MSSTFRLLAIAAGASIAIGIGACGHATAPDPVQPTVTAQRHAHGARANASMGLITHIVVVVQENRSFDNLFNGFPGADTVQVGQASNGSTITLQPVGLESPWDLGHTRNDFIRAYDSGKMDGFNLEAAIPATSPPPPDFAYSYVPQSETGPYWAMASQYVLADRMFESNSGPSFPAHQYLFAAQSADAVSNPYLPGVTEKTWGCDSPAGTVVDTISPTTGKITGHVFPCFTYPSVAGLMDAATQPWAVYAVTADQSWDGFSAIQEVRYTGDWANDVHSPETSFLTDVANGKLAALTFIIPRNAYSDHSRSKSSMGPQWVASVVNAVGNSPFWNTTAIFVVWDDWGGWYDHVAPQQFDATGLGFRVPLLVISPYALSGYVSHVQHEFGSILKFTEETYGLPSLNGVDARADDLSDCFNFTQTPRPFVPLPTTVRPASFLSQPPPDIPNDDDQGTP